MQACPYDALYIDPVSLTAAKCNYCTHRVDQGYEPACVVVCPVEAIVSGDLDNPTSRIARLDRTLHVQYPTVEKGTNPKLFYVGGETAAMDPAAAPPASEYLWSASAGVSRSTLASAEAEAEEESARARRVYDVSPKGTQWGMKVSAYITTKAISAGVVAVAFLSFVFGAGERVLTGRSALLSLTFLAITGALLVADLKQPSRFHYVMLRPQWRSWLVRGAYLILLFSILVPLTWLLSVLAAPRSATLIVGGITAAVGLCVACYTALLLAQAKGRDYWQNPLLVLSMGADALVAGAAVSVLAGVSGLPPEPGTWLAFGAASLGVLLAVEFATVHQTQNAARTARMILAGRYRRDFWGGVVLLGIAAPGLIAVGGGSATLASLLLLLGIAIKGHLLIQAPQQVPLS
jgi:formate-dependent nitrite reductase membrane component NrfD